MAALTLVLIVFIVFYIKSKSKQQQQQRDSSRFDAELEPLSDLLAQELDGKTGAQAVAHVKQRLPAIRRVVLDPPGYNPDAFWGANSGLTLVIHQKNGKVSTFEIGRDDAFVSNYVNSAVPPEVANW